MPIVGKKKFPYTAKGMKKAAEERMMMKEKEMKEREMMKAKAAKKKKR